jgi:hypothetical protein
MARALETGGLGAALVASCLLAGSCGSLQDQSPTRPDPTPEPVAVTPTAQPPTSPPPAPVFGPGAPKATPTPEASPEPTPGATPAPPSASGCGSPTPPPLSRVNVKVHIRGADTWVIDSTPLVGPDAVYCAKIGFTDGRSFCPVRPEGNPERGACEEYVTGRAADTGRPGPTWYLGGGFCTGRAAGCENHPENQYQVLAYRGGTYRACGRNGVCGEVEADK